MKKILIGAFIALMSASLFAKTWTNNVGVGFTMPISTISSDEEGAEDVIRLDTAHKASILATTIMALR